MARTVELDDLEAHVAQERADCREADSRPPHVKPRHAAVRLAEHARECLATLLA